MWSWGAILRSSLLSDQGDFGQRDDDATPFGLIALERRPKLILAAAIVILDGGQIEGDDEPFTVPSWPTRTKTEGVSPPNLARASSAVRTRRMTQ